MKQRIAIFASGSGTNAENIIQHFKGHATIEVAVILTNKADAYVLERAKKYAIPSHVFNREEFRDPSFTEALHKYKVSHIVLAGFLWLVPKYLIENYPDRIVNIHPALLPKFGGKGMYGAKVHEAVKLAGENQTGITIHLVNEHYDEGAVLFQASCPVLAEHSPEDIANCVHALEYKHYPSVIENWIEGR